jgi:hypothetical protein
MKRFFGKRRATRTTLGELTARPLERLGALVFQPDNSERIMLGQLLGCDPDSRLCVELCSAITRWENVLSEKPLLTLPNNTTTPRPAIRRAPGYGSGQDPQGIARHVPSCPAALHLDRASLRQNAPLSNCLESCVSSANCRKPQTERGFGISKHCAGADGCKKLRCSRTALLLLALPWRSRSDKPAPVSVCSRTPR